MGRLSITKILQDGFQMIQFCFSLFFSMHPFPTIQHVLNCNDSSEAILLV